MTRTLPAWLAIPFCLFPLTVQADTRLTAGLTSNEIWRGLSQSDNELSPFVGLDVGAETDPYLGAWAGKVDFGDGNSTGLDFYSGWYFARESFEFDAGFYNYAYPGSVYDDSDQVDAYLAFIGGAVTVGWEHTLWGQAGQDAPYTAGDDYVFASYTHQLEENWSVKLTAGYYRFDEDEVVWGNNDFGQLRLDLKYREFSIGISGAGSGSGNSDTLILAAWTWSVDLP